MDTISREALEEAVAASVSRDKRADELLATFSKGYKLFSKGFKLIGIALALVMLACLILGGIVIWNWRASDARAGKFETVLVCVSNSERAAAVDIGQAKKDGNHYVVPVTCAVPK